MSNGNAVRAAFLFLLLRGISAPAAPNDLELAQLGSPYPISTRYSEGANADFRSMSLFVGTAVTASQLSAPKPLGPMGFRTQLSLTAIQVPSEAVIPSQQPSRGPLNIWMVSMRKGLPWSFDLGAHIGWVENSQMYIASAEAKYVFTDLINFGFRIHTDQLANARDLKLSTVGSDLSLGKSFPISGVLTLVPYAGWNLVWLSSQSTQVDFRPERSASESFRVPNSQLADTGVFDTVSFNNNNLNRFYAGVQLKMQAFVFSASWANVLASRFKSQERWVTPPSSNSWNVSLGLDY